MTKFKASTRKDLPQIAEKLKLDKEQILDMQAVSAVLPFRVNDYVVENLIDPSDVPDDPIFQLTFPQRGMLEETLVVFLTDFGRTPKINGNGGRDHHPGVYSLVLAGGGIRGGQVYGSSDRKGAEPGSDPCSPADVHATVYRAMGINPDMELHDQQGRPFRICDGQPLPLT